MRFGILLAGASVAIAAGLGVFVVQQHGAAANAGRSPRMLIEHAPSQPAAVSGNLLPQTVVLRELPLAARSAAAAASAGERDSAEGKEARERTPVIGVAEADRRRALAAKQPVKAARIQQLNPAVPGLQRPQAPADTAQINLQKGFEGPDISNCCAGSEVPPDSHLAVGPNHLVATVNSAIAVYAKDGRLLHGPVLADTFFNNPSCTSTFDPTVEYDEGADRWVLNFDSSPNDCIAVSASGDPTGAWHVYAFDSGIDVGNGDFFDYPHIGVGDQAIYLGANIYIGTTGFAARVWALNKALMYAGQPLPAPTAHDLSDGGMSVGTPTPMVLHGAPSAPGVEYIVTDDTGFSGDTFGIWLWTDASGATAPSLVGYADLAAATGVNAQLPIDQVQLGTTLPIQANDVRTLDAEWRNGKVWLAHQMSCNVGAGVQGCARWAQVDPTDASVVQAGVATVFGKFVSFPNLAVDANDDMALGFSVMGASRHPSVYIAGRYASDPKGLLRDAIEVKRGQSIYQAFDVPPQRWGDYSGMAADPDGQRLWYIGEYAKAGMPNPFVPGGDGNWGTYIQQVGFGVPDNLFADGFEPQAAVELHAEVNGDDADAAPGNGFAVGDPVHLTFVVINTGRVRLSNVLVNDATLGIVTCPTNTLEAGADMICSVTVGATAGAHASSASVTGVAPNGTVVSDSNAANYQGALILAGTRCSAAGGAGCAEALVDHGTVTSTFNVSGCGTIDDVNVGLSVDHTYIGDLVISLTSPAATTVRLLNSPPNGVGYCSGDNVRALLDDASSGVVVDTVCTDQTPSIFGSFKPSQALSGFNGQGGNGTWTLTVQDLYPQDTGTLNDWSLQLTCH